MKLKLISCIIFTLQICAMDLDKRGSIEFLTPQQVNEQCDKLPSEFQATEKWIQDNRDVFKALRINELRSHQQYTEHMKVVEISLQWNKLKSLSPHNYIFDTGNGTVVRYSGDGSTLRSMASSAGIDSGPTLNMMDIFEEDGKKFGLYKPDVLQAATITHGTVPIYQHTSSIAYYLLMKKRLKGKIKPQPTYPVRYGEKEDFHDGNYVVVQPALSSKSYVLLKDVPRQAFHPLITREVLDDLELAVQSGAWNLNTENLWLNVINNEMVITDLEKPNNEGWGPSQKWGTAVFSAKGDGASNHQWKWDHNVRVGYDAVQSGILEKSIHKQQLIPEWQQRKKEHAPKE